MKSILLVVCYVWLTFDTVKCEVTDDDREDYKIYEYMLKATRLREDGYSWLELDKEMGIWRADDPDRNLEIDHANVFIEQGKNYKSEIDKIYELLVKRYAVDKVRLLEQPEGGKLSPDAIRIIQYVSEVK